MSGGLDSACEVMRRFANSKIPLLEEEVRSVLGTERIRRARSNWPRRRVFRP